MSGGFQNRLARTYLGILAVAFAVVGTLACWTAPARAQQLGVPSVPILTINSDRLYSESDFGQRVAREVEEESAVLAAENRRIEAELTAEESALTEQRPDLEAGAFRALADAFDTKVSEIRRTQDKKARDLVGRSEDARLIFLQASRPVLGALMRETGASVILERSSVFLSANATDVTDLALDRINAAIGDGSTLDLPAEEATPTQPAD